MAEAAGVFDLRRIGLIAGVSAVIIFAVLFLFVRGCANSSRTNNSYSVVYSNLDLKDAANTVARLKELAIPYEIRDEGRSIAVPKVRSDEARLSLAEKNLPAGGVVGWEIFDESKLGATDFDRRIQLIRAISGELCRTIRTIRAIDDVRVQIVMPETKLFATQTVPVTASVLLKLKPGEELSDEKINGIVHLVASSVENLQLENVTVIDNTGRILTAKNTYLVLPKEIEETPVPVISVVSIEASPLITKGSIVIIHTPEVKILAPTILAVPSLEAKLLISTANFSPEEKMLLKVRAKKEVERDLAGKAQEILNRFYPPNSVIVKVNADLKQAPSSTQFKLNDLKITSLTAIVLIDNRFEMASSLKQTTYKTVAAAIGYNQKRGDKILIQKVPFHLANPLIDNSKTTFTQQKPVYGRGLNWLKIALAILLIGLAVLIISKIAQALLSRKKIEEQPIMPVVGTQSNPRPAASMAAQLKSFAESNPDKIAELLRKWLTE